MAEKIVYISVVAAVIIVALITLFLVLPYSATLNTLAQPSCGTYRSPNYIDSTGFTISPHPYYYEYSIQPNSTGYMNFTLENLTATSSKEVTNTFNLFYAVNGSFISDPEAHGINLSISPKNVLLKPGMYQLVVGKISVSPTAPEGDYIALEQGLICGPDYGFILVIGSQSFSGPFYKGNLTT